MEKKGGEKKAVTPWYEDDRFWRGVESALFSPDKMSAARREVDGVVSLLSLKTGACVLDLCSGPGRHALELAGRGYQVTAVDRTRMYLERARKAAKQQGLEVEFVKEDMRTFVRPGAFDAVINLYTSFGYFEEESENRLVLENACASLREGGAALFELTSKEIVARDFRERNRTIIGDISLLEVRSAGNHWDWLETRWVVNKGGRNRDFTWKIRLYTRREFEAMLSAAGFQDLRTFGGLDGSPYDHEARRLVVAARRPL